MDTTERLISTSPLRAGLDPRTLSECIDAANQCEIACTQCADSCLGENAIAQLRLCIRLNLDCADICGTTGRILGRLLEPDPELLRAQVGACAAACTMCASECQRHGSMLEYCRVCAGACRWCEDACRRVLRELPASAD